jgi:hypothetical protein
MPGAIVTAGSPGIGGVGAVGGNGGPGGPGRKCSFPATDAKAGAPRAEGTNGPNRANGRLTP